MSNLTHSPNYAPVSFGSGGRAHTATSPEACPVANILPLGPTQVAQVAGPAPCGTHAAGAAPAADVGDCPELGVAGSSSGKPDGRAPSSGSLGASASSF